MKSLTVKNKFTEPVKDILYRYFGVFPPYPPMRLSLPALSPESKKTIDDLRTVCLFLGPHRNLTTLTASTLALHPNCQVLSHGGPRVLPVEELNFLENYSDEKMVNFLHFALVMSETGDRGEYGGSITVTHPFRDHPIIRETYRRRYGRAMAKKEIHCLVWKEAHLVSEYVAEKNIDLGQVLRQNDKLQIIMPVRNPIHVAFSFFSRDRFMQKFYAHLERNDINGVLDDVLGKMADAVTLQKNFPDRVMIFFEDEISSSLFVRMAHFLRISPEGRWIKDTLACFDVQPAKYEVPQSLTKYYKDRVAKVFENSPEIALKFEQFS